MKLPSLVTGILLVLIAGTSVSSCSLIGPHADAVLLNLAQQANNDAAMTRDPDFKAVRATQAQELKEEITRLCGVRPDGTVYPSCAEDLSHPAVPSHDVSGSTQTEVSPGQNSPQSPAQSSDQWTQAALQISKNVDKAPTESRELLVREALELLRRAPQSVDDSFHLSTPLKSSFTAITSSDQAILEEVLRREYATVYYLGLALGYLDDIHANSHQAIFETHQRCIDELNTALSDLSVTIVPELSYELGQYPQPQDDASGLALADAVNEDAIHQLQQAASQVSDSEIRWWLINYAAASSTELSEKDPTQRVPAQ